MIALPSIQREGMNAMLMGRSMRSPTHPEGFTFCTYPVGSLERMNFLEGCVIVAFPPKKEATHVPSP